MMSLHRRLDDLIGNGIEPFLGRTGLGGLTPAADFRAVIEDPGTTEQDKAEARVNLANVEADNRRRVEQLLVSAVDLSDDDREILEGVLAEPEEFELLATHVALEFDSRPNDIDFVTPVAPQIRAEPFRYDAFSQRYLRAFGQNVRPIQFVVGPGFLQSGTSSESIENVPDELNNFRLTAGQRAFVDGLTKERKGPRQWRDWGGTGVQMELASFRLNLVKFAHASKTAFAAAAKDQMISDRSPVELTATASSRLGDSLKDVLMVVAGDVEREIGVADSALLGIERILELLGEWREDRRNPDGALSLFASDVQWFADLVWHSWIFRSRLYPTTEELTTQLSIIWASPTEPFRRMAPPQRVGLVGATTEALVGPVERCLSRGDVPNRLRYSAYDALADLLWAEWNKFSALIAHGEVANLPATELIPGGNHGDGDSKFVPVVFSLTPDLELEKALLRTRPENGDFHVLVPVLAAYDSNGQQVLRWILGTYCNDRRHPSLPRWRLAESLALSEVEGPVVVKLAGSPLHPIPPLRKGRVLYPSTHALNVGEGHFMNHAATAQLALAWRSGVQKPGDAREVKGEVVQALPEWLTAGVKERRPDWWLLGVRLADWVGRFQLFLQLRLLYPTTHDSLTQRSYAFSQHWSDVRAIESIGVQCVTAGFKDLEQLMRDLAAVYR